MKEEEKELEDGDEEGEEEQEEQEEKMEAGKHLCVHCIVGHGMSVRVCAFVCTCVHVCAPRVCLPSFALVLYLLLFLVLFLLLCRRGGEPHMVLVFRYLQRLLQLQLGASTPLHLQLLVLFEMYLTLLKLLQFLLAYFCFACSPSLSPPPSLCAAADS